MDVRRLDSLYSLIVHSRNSLHLLFLDQIEDIVVARGIDSAFKLEKELKSIQMASIARDSHDNYVKMHGLLLETLRFIDFVRPYTAASSSLNVAKTEANIEELEQAVNEALPSAARINNDFVNVLRTSTALHNMFYLSSFYSTDSLDPELETRLSEANKIRDSILSGESYSLSSYYKVNEEAFETLKDAKLLTMEPTPIEAYRFKEEIEIYEEGMKALEVSIVLGG